MSRDLAAVLAVSADHVIRAELERQLSLGLVASWPRAYRVRMLELLLGGHYRSTTVEHFCEGAIDA